MSWLFLETRVKENKFIKVSNKINKMWEYCNNYEKATNERVWIGWNPKKVNVTVRGIFA